MQTLIETDKGKFILAEPRNSACHLWVEDFQLLFDASPNPYLILCPDLPQFTILAVNKSFLAATGTEVSTLIGQGIFEVFPDNPSDPMATGVRDLKNSLERVVKQKTTDVMGVQKYDIPRRDSQNSEYEMKYWSPVNTPAFQADGSIAFIIHHAEDITSFVLAQEEQSQPQKAHEKAELKVFQGAQKLKQANRQLRLANEELSQRERALRESEERFSVIFHKVDIGIIIVQLDGKIIRCNEKHAEILGYRQEELITKRVQNITYPADMEYTTSCINGLASGQASTCQYEVRVIRKDGNLRWIKNNAALVRKEQQAPQYFITAIEDITERKQAEESLQITLSELQHMKKAIDASTIVAITDKQGIITYVNEAFCHISKYSREELLGKTHKIINSGFHSAEFFKTMWSTIGHGRVWKGEIRNRAKDNTYYWVDTTIYPFLDDNGQPTQYIAIRHDITAQKQATEGLKTAEYRQKLISLLGQRALSGSSVTELMDQALQLVAGALHVDLAKVLELNQDRKTLILTAGYGFEEGVVGHAKVDAGIRSQAGYTLLVNEPVVVEDFNREIRFTRPQLLENYGILSGISMVINTLSLERPYGVLSVHCRKPGAFSVEDVTFIQGIANVLANAIEHNCAEEKIRRFNQELEQRVVQRTEEYEQAAQEAELANKEKSRVLAMVSHDFKTPLAGISRFVEILRKQGTKNMTEDQQEILGYIDMGIDQLRVMIREILDKARVTEGRVSINVETIVIKPFIEDLLPTLKTLAEEKGIRLDWDTSASASTLEADPMHLRQILTNLLSNAIKYNVPNGHVLLRIYHDETNQVHVFEVQDTGVGIPQGKIESIFNEFSRLAEHAQKAEGTGLGLAGTKRLVELQGGTITVTSQEGVGSTFLVKLPLVIQSRTLAAKAD